MKALTLVFALVSSALTAMLLCFGLSNPQFAASPAHAAEPSTIILMLLYMGMATIVAWRAADQDRPK